MLAARGCTLTADPQGASSIIGSTGWLEAHIITFIAAHSWQAAGKQVGCITHQSMSPMKLLIEAMQARKSACNNEPVDIRLAWLREK
jgi:hypothetical protein